MWLRVWDKTKEKDGKNEAIYELHTGVKESFSDMRFWKDIIERLLSNIEPNRFMVLLQEDEQDKFVFGILARYDSPPKNMAEALERANKKIHILLGKDSKKHNNPKP